MVVEFWHEQCVFCKRLAPIYTELAEEYKGKAKFTTLNVFASPENQHIAFHFRVMSTPALIFFCSVRPVAATIGFQPKDCLKQFIEDFLKNSIECIKKSAELKIA